MTKRSQIIIITYDGVEGGAVCELLRDEKALTNNSHL